MVDGTVNGTYWTSEKEVGDKDKLKEFSSTYVGSDSLAELMAKHPETTYVVDTHDPDALVNMLLGLLPTVVLVFLMFYFMRQMMGANNKAMQFGKTNAKTNEATRSSLTALTKSLVASSLGLPPPPIALPMLKNT